MAVVSMYAIANFFEGELKLIGRGENATESNHVKEVVFDGTLGIVRGKVQASMKNNAYNVQVMDITVLCV